VVEPWEEREEMDEGRLIVHASDVEIARADTTATKEICIVKLFDFKNEKYAGYYKLQFYRYSWCTITEMQG